MKIWIDKHGGMHYHKENCRILQGIVGGFQPTYEEVEYSGKLNHVIRIDGRDYAKCLFCFGDRRNK